MDANVCPGSCLSTYILEALVGGLQGRDTPALRALHRRRAAPKPVAPCHSAADVAEAEDWGRRRLLSTALGSGAQSWHAVLEAHCVTTHRWTDATKAYMLELESPDECPSLGNATMAFAP